MCSSDLPRGLGCGLPAGEDGCRQRCCGTGEQRQPEQVERHPPVESLRIDDMRQDRADGDAAGQAEQQADAGDQRTSSMSAWRSMRWSKPSAAGVASSRARNQTLAVSVTASPKTPMTIAASRA